jgi:hypothetical protein
MVATRAGSGNNDSIQQSFTTALPAGGTYTLSFWYRQNTVGTPLVARLNTSTTSAGVYVTLDPRLPASGESIIPGATPGAVNSVATNLPAFPPLWLNELQADNVTGPLDNFGQHDPWAELFNTANTNVSLAGYFLSDSYTNLTRWAFPASAVASNGFTLIWCDGATNQTTASALHAGLTLRSGSGSLLLSHVINGATQVVDYVNYTNVPANRSFGSVPDAQPFYRRPMFHVSAGATNNGASAPLTVFINEWMADNATTLADPADGQFEDWFELFNPGTNAVDVGGYYLTDNLTNKPQFLIPNNGHYVIPAGGCLFVWADNESGQNSTNRADLHANFALARSGDAIGLFAADGTTIDAVSFATQTNNASEGRFPNGAAAIYAMPTPTPRMPNIVPNTAPSLVPIEDRVVTLGQTLQLSAVGSDGDLPPQTLGYTLGSAPAGAQIEATSGLLVWTLSTAPATNVFTVVVADDGTPSLSAAQTFVVITAPMPVVQDCRVVGNELRLSAATFAGQKIQLEISDDLSETAWLPAGDVVIGTGSIVTFVAPLDDELPQRYFRIRVLP